jgi:hypothetical protein
MRFALATVVCFAFSPVVVTAQSSFVVSDVRLFDGERAIERRSVLVENGRISRIGGPELRFPPNTEVSMVAAGRCCPDSLTRTFTSLTVRKRTCDRQPRWA